MSETRSELDADVAAPTLDRATSFDILNNQHRRTIITLLAETPTLTRHELTTHLAATVTDNASQPTSDQKRRLRIALHHNHLPQLADAGLIEYDADTVTATATLAAVAHSLLDA